MNRFNLALIPYLLICTSAFAQDNVKVVSAEEFYEHQQIRISQGQGWAFKKGHDSSWASVDLSTHDWDTLKPTDLSAALADENGRLEGWFRLRIRLDSSFQDLEIGIIQKVWAATDIYLDGDSLYSFGNTGINGEPFEEFKPDGSKQYGVPINDGNEHLLAIHFVDFVSPLLGRLKSEDKSHVFINLTGPEFTYNFLTSRAATLKGTSSLFAILALLTALFWFFYFQSKRERNLLFIAIAATAYSTAPINDVLNPIQGNSFLIETLLDYLGMFSVFAIIVFVPLTYSQIIRGSIHPFLWILSGLLFGYSQFGFFSAEFYDPSGLIIGFLAISIGVCLYYTFRNWKTISGPKWAVVGGLLATMGFVLIILIYLAFIFALDIKINGEIVGGIMLAAALSFPLSLLVYVFLWFFSINRNVEKKALEVVRITEEKKAILAEQNTLLESQVEQRTEELKTSLDNLKSTQSQLIHSEKMASLGELTAGIAHEIQNPLNFVNNFSEVNKELLEEVKVERKKGKGEQDEDLQDEILNDIQANSEKISHHGKRAEQIVKSMLQHSRAGSGEKELTDINALCDEYMRLAYHGFRAKDKSGSTGRFNVEYKLDLDPNLPQIEVVPQDIGRVLLNIINNAFQAVSAVATEQSEEAKADIVNPQVKLITNTHNNSITISVADNGPGIPSDIRDKIFQPFFTTKPTGEGTGLGLSMSYDIVTKGHGGTIEMESSEGLGTAFSIQIPFT